jgi:pseudouridine synthase
MAGHRPFFECLPVEIRDRVQPVGRLDRDTCGLLVLTGDGRLIQWLGHPRRAIPRTYRAVLSDAPDPERLEALKAGRLVLRDGHAPRPLAIGPVSGPESGPASEAVSGSAGGSREWEITLAEGKYHEVRRIFGATGVRVVELVRLRFGPFSLDACGPEGWVRLSEDEALAFYAQQGLELPARVVEVQPDSDPDSNSGARPGPSPSTV